MRHIFNITALLLLVYAFVACEDKPEVYQFEQTKYYYDIPDVPVTEDYVVGVPYDLRYRTFVSNEGHRVDYGWWDNTLKSHSLYTGTPVLGEYDMRYDLDQTLLQHLQWGKQAGIDFFMVSWGGHGWNDTIFMKWREYAAQDPQLPKLVLRFDPGYRFDGKDTLMLDHLRTVIVPVDDDGDEIPDTIVVGGKKTPVLDTLYNQPSQLFYLKRDLDSLHRNLFQDDFYYKNRNNGKPVMVLCNFQNTGHIISTWKFTDILRQTVGDDIWIMGELGGGWSSPEYWGYHSGNGYPDAEDWGTVKSDTIKAFDAFFNTDITTSNYDRYYGFYSFLDYNYGYWQKKVKNVGKEYCPTIFPAFDNRVNNAASTTYLIPRWKEGVGAYVISAASGSTTYNWSDVTTNPYKTLANVAKRNVGACRILMIYNWNNFGNGNTLEPTVEYGEEYLNYTKQFFKK